MSTDTITKAKEWFRSLSFNEQKEYANKFLLSYEVSMLMGDTTKYTSKTKWDELHVKLYEKFQANNLVVSKIDDEIIKHFPKHIDKNDWQWCGFINDKEIVVMRDDCFYSVFSKDGYHGTMDLGFTMTELIHVANYKGRKYNFEND